MSACLMLLLHVNSISLSFYVHLCKSFFFSLPELRLLLLLLNSNTYEEEKKKR